MRSRPTVLGSGRTIPMLGSLPFGMGRRLHASIMFLDLCRFSEWPGNTEVEQDQILRILTLFFSEAIAIIEDYGGIVEKNTGDGLMAYFVGDSVANDAHRSVACAMTLFDAARRFVNPELQATGIAPLKFRICIDRGAVTIANVGRRNGYRGIVAVGSVANRASKMLVEAAADTILIGDNVYHLLPVGWETRAVPAIRPSWGWTDPVTGSQYPLWEFDACWTEPTKGMFGGRT